MPKKGLASTAAVLAGAAFITMLTFGVRLAFAQACESEMQECSRLQDKLIARNQVLKKNRDFLVEHPEASPSAKIKVRSNIAMAEIQIETISNQVSLLSAEMKKKGCAECKL